jgi:hypothetical protein
MLFKNAVKKGLAFFKVLPFSNSDAHSFVQFMVCTIVDVIIIISARRNRQVFSLSLRDIIYLPISEHNWLR